MADLYRGIWMNTSAMRFSKGASSFLSRFLICVILAGASLSAAYSAPETVASTYLSYASGDYYVFTNCNVGYGPMGIAAEQSYYSCVYADVLASVTPYLAPPYNATLSGSPSWSYQDLVLQREGYVTLGGNQCWHESNGDGVGCVSGGFNLECPLAAGGGYYADTPGGLHVPYYCLILANTHYNTGCPTCAAKVGNPIDTASGNKYQEVTDYRGGGAFPAGIQPCV